MMIEPETGAPLEVGACLLGGPGLFFAGASFLSSSLKAMAGPSLRRFLAKVTKTAPGQIMAGLTTGGIAQSSSVASFIMASMIASGMITLSLAAPVVLWANVGTSVLVFLATFNIEEVSFYFLGLVGLGFYLHLQDDPRFRGPIYLILGLSLIFIGITHTKAAAEMASHWEWFRDLLEFSAVVSPLLFVFAIGLAYIARSSATVSVVAIAFAQSNLISELDAVIMILGANVGSGLVALELSRQMRGAPKQLLVTQTLSKFIGTAALVPYLIPDAVFGWTTIGNSLAWFSPSLSVRLSVAFLILQMTGAVLTHLFLKPVLSVVERYWPIEQEAKWSEPEFIYPAAVNEPSSAADLALMECNRVGERFFLYFKPLLPPGDPDHEDIALAPLKKANDELNEHISRFLREIEDHHPPRAVIHRLTKIERILEFNKDINRLFCRLTRESTAFLANPSTSAAARDYIYQLSRENFDDARNIFEMVMRHSEEDMERLNILDSRTEELILEQIRNELFAKNPDMPQSDQEFIIKYTSLFSRINWILERVVLLLDAIWSQAEEDSETEKTPPETASEPATSESSA